MNLEKYFILYKKLKKYAKESKAINLQKLIFFTSYEASSGYYHEDSKKNIIDDFITSPLISNFFGYLIGFFLYSKWKKFFYKKEIDLIELGPGSGKLIFDVLNFLKQTDMFGCIKKIKLLEINDLFSKNQANLLNEFKNQIEFYKDFGLINFERSFFVFSNEFFDCLPFNQFIYKDNKFFETCIFFDEKNDEFKFGLSSEVSNNLFLLKEKENFDREPKDESVFEISSSSILICQEINNLLNKFGGINLIIDYGFLKNEYKSSIQCIRNHKNISISDLIKFGGDISSHVNFEYLKKIFEDNSSEEFFLDEQYIFFNEIYEDFTEFLFENRLYSLDKDKLIQKINNEILKFTKNDLEADLGKLFKVLYKIKK